MRDRDKRAVIYCRVSSDGQEDNTSLETQEKECRAHAEKCGFFVVGVYTEVISGTTFPYDRPEMAKALVLLRDGEAGVLLAYRRNRLWRKVSVAASLEHYLAKDCKGARIVTMDSGDTDTPEERLMRHMLDAFSEYERDMIAYRTMLGRRSMRAKGLHIGGSAPFGLSVDAETGLLSALAGEMEMVTEAFKLHDSGLKVSAIVSRMNEVGGRRDGSAWTKTKVSRLLKNRDMYARVGLVPAGGG